MRTPEEFQRQAKLKNITYWKSHDCVICGVAVGTEIKNGIPSYNSSCSCAQSPNHNFGWEFVAERYNIQRAETVIKRMDEFWGFAPESKIPKQTKTFEGFPYPKTNVQEILLTLLTKGSVSIFDFPTLSGYRTRVSELQTFHNLPLIRVIDTRCNKFGNTYNYAIHKLSNDQKENAIALYYKLNKE